MNKKALYIGATNQDVGKTTTCLGIYHALKKRFNEVGFIKPVGQKTRSLTSGDTVDKDVALFQSYFGLTIEPKDMSPILFPRGFTKQILDGQVNSTDLTDKIQASYNKIDQAHPFTLVEGTGHMGVGSIADVSCATIASLLDLDVVLVTTGGIGSTFDDLILSKSLCDQKGVSIKGVIVNKVLPDKKEATRTYIEKALHKLNLPLLGVIEFYPFLSSPTMEDFELLFDTPILSAKQHKRRHYLHMLLATGAATNIQEHYEEHQMIILNAAREDLVAHILDHHPRKCGFIFTGKTPPSAQVIAQLEQEQIPAIYAAAPSYSVMEKMTKHIAKIQAGDTKKIAAAIELVEQNIDIEEILR